MTDRTTADGAGVPTLRSEDTGGPVGPIERLPPPNEAAWSRELVKQIAKDVGDAVVFHIETMYPRALAATPTTFPLSVRNTVFNEILAATEVNDAAHIAARIEERRRARRNLRAASRKMRAGGKSGQNL